MVCYVCYRDNTSKGTGDAGVVPSEETFRKRATANKVNAEVRDSIFQELVADKLYRRAEATKMPISNHKDTIG